jgi:hypothetical protein
MFVQDGVEAGELEEVNASDDGEPHAFVKRRPRLRCLLDRGPSPEFTFGNALAETFRIGRPTPEVA